MSMLAHQGGWDEILMVGVPLLLLALVLRAAKRRADRMLEKASPPPADANGPASVSPDAPPTPPAH